MSLGSLLLQPQRLQRTSAGPEAAIVADALRLLTLLAEDAVADGPLTQALPDVVTRIGNRVQTRSGGGMAAVSSALKARMKPLFLYFEGLVRDIENLDQEPAALLAIMRDIVSAARTAVAGLTQAGIQAELDFAKQALEQLLGFDRHFIGSEIGALLDDVVTVWQQLPADLSPARRRRKRLAIQTVRRLRRHLIDRFTLPEIDTARAANRLYRLLRSSGMVRVFEEIHCVLEKFDAAVAATQDIGAALPIAGVGGGSVGAALIAPEGAARYCWYASWVLSDVDLPLLGTGDIDDKKAFLNLFRTHQGATVKAATVTRFFFSELSVDLQRQVLDYDGVSDPEPALLLALVAHINRFMTGGPISSHFTTPHANQSPNTPVTAPFEFRLLSSEVISPSEHFTDELKSLHTDYDKDQTLYLYNRRFLEWAYGDLIDSLCCRFLRYVERKTIGIRRDVYISGNRRYLMCDDKPLYTVPEGTELKWQDAPLFVDKNSGRRAADGGVYYSFKRINAAACDVIAQVLFGLEQTARPIWHLVELQPGHSVGTGIVSGLDIAHALNEILFGKPISGYESLGGWGKWLANDYYGPRGLALLGGSFQGLHTSATAGNGFWFWLTVVLGDFIRIGGHNSRLQAGRDFFLTFFTLLNASASNSGDSSLSRHPGANHLKQSGITSPMNTLFSYLLLLNYKRENHSIEIWSADDIGDQREHAFGLWFGGCAGFGILAGLAGGIFAQIVAWQEDFKLLGITIAESSAFLFLTYWVFEYLFKEGDTADGTYALTGEYKGYPARSTSPYRLPAESGTALYMGQGNTGLFSHNDISSNWQVYAFDLGFDHGQIIRAMRGGVVWDFAEGFADNNENDPNFIVIRHDTQIADHDDPRGSNTPVVTFARYLHGAENGVSNAFGFTPVREMDTPGGGTVVAQGDPIMQADDTGTSFHSHLHLQVVTGTATNPTGISIPLVFADVDGDGLMKALTWYRAGE
jgi:hypothetical protein